MLHSKDGLVQQLQSQLINLQDDFQAERDLVSARHEGHLLTAWQSFTDMKGQRDSALACCAEMQSVLAQVRLWLWLSSWLA